MDTKNFHLTISNVLLEWNVPEKSSIITMTDELKFMEESKINLFPKILAVGPDCKTVKPNQYAVTNTPSLNLITIDGIKYGLVKEHQIDFTIDKLPSTVERLEGDKIKTEKTSKKVNSFQQRASKHDIEIN